MKHPNDYWPAKITNKGDITPGIVELELMVPKDFQVKLGQFIMMPCWDKLSTVRRPFSVVSQKENYIKIWVKPVGPNTYLYSQAARDQVGCDEEITIEGPKGTPIKIGSEEKYILVAGGIGLAPLMPLATELCKIGKQVKVVVGSKEEFFYQAFSLPGEVQVTTVIEEGKNGLLATEELLTLLKKDGGKSRVVACGPKGMLKKVAELSEQYSNKCEVIVEEFMACGSGSCKGCTIFGKDVTSKQICSDGPTFDAEWIDWPKFMRQSTHEIIKPTKVKPTMNIISSRENSDNYLCLEYPTMNCSGTLGIEDLEKGNIDLSRLGALVTKGVTVEPRVGNKMPRICEVDLGIINSIGLQNVGIKKFIDEELPRWLKLHKPVIVNICGSTFKEYEQLAKALGKTDIAGIEINISCPNIKDGGLAFGTDTFSAAYITDLVCRAAPYKFVIVKLTPNVTDIVSIAKAVKEAGADAISAINTIQAMDIDINTRRSRIGAITGGLSGPAVFPVALRAIYQLRQAKLGIPIIGMGGIKDAKSAGKFFMAGADAIAIGTASFGRPTIFTEVFNGLEKIIKQHGFNSIQGLTGSFIPD